MSTEASTVDVEHVLRRQTPQVVGALVRRYGNFDAAEDAVQEALLAAAQQWPDEGMPDNPQAWLVTVASRRLTDRFRSDEARRRREEGSFDPTMPRFAPAADDAPAAGDDDSLTLLFMCCHPALNPPAQAALTLRAVGGLTTAEIAAAFLTSDSTMAQRISRAKQQIKRSGATFALPEADVWSDRLVVVLQVLYLVFNEGYAATSGERLHRTDLTTEAIRLTRMVFRLLPDDPEVAGLLALMLLTEARRPARMHEDGSLVPLAEQDRTRWNRDLIDEGVALISAALPRGAVGPYQVQAAIAAVHDEAARAQDTDWAQIDQLYSVLDQLTPGPMITLNRAVAVAMVHGPSAGLALLAELDADPRVAGHHRLSAVRAHLLEMAGDAGRAREQYGLAARGAVTEPERRYLRDRAARLT